MSISQRRAALTHHDTEAARRVAGVDPTIFWAYKPGDRVLSREGLLGTVQDVLDGPNAGDNIYIVALDAGMGGGEYGENEISPAPGSRVAVRSFGEPDEDLEPREAVGDQPHVASEDYPELAHILVDRPPLAHAVKVASFMATDGQGNVLGGPYDRADQARDAHPGADIHPYSDQQPWNGWGTGEEADTDAFALGLTATVTPVSIQPTGGIMDKIVDGIDKRLPADKRYDPRGNWSFDWCRFRKRERCYFPKELDYEATKKEGYAVWVPFDRGRCLRPTWDEQRACPVGEPGPNSGEPNSLLDATIPYDEGGQRGGIPAQASLMPPPGDADLIAVANRSADFRFEFTSAWKDVREKAKRIRAEGGVRILSSTGSTITAEVKGDEHVYQTTLMRQPGRQAVALWDCGCEWAKYAWGRSGRWKRYEGRMCSHALALNFEAQAQEWMGGTIHEQADAPAWTDGVKTILPSRERPSAWQIGQPRRAALSAEAMAPIKANPSMEEIVAWYSAQARSEEPKITRLIEGLAVHNGGKAEGLQFRFKKPEKILDKIKRKNFSTGDPRSWIDDALRYTIVFHPSIYSAQVQDTLYGLQEGGYKIVEESNSWLRGDPYSDLKYVFEAPSGMHFELQFHTQESLDLKERALHQMYEEFRDTSTPLKRRQELFDTMTAYWDHVEIPPDVLEYPVEKRYLRPVATSSDLQRSLAEVIKEAWNGQGVMGNVRGEVVQVLALLPDGMVRIQGGECVPASSVLHPRFSPTRGLTPRSAALMKAAEINPSDPNEGLRLVQEECEKGNHTHSGLVIKAVDTGRVLLTQRTPYADDPEGVNGRWEFPGGGIEDGQTALESAIREFTEETGLTLPEDARVDGCYSTGPYMAVIVLVPNESWTTNAQLLTFETMGIGWFHPDHIEGADIARKEMDDAEWDMVREAVHHVSWTEPGTTAYDAHTTLNNAVRDGDVTKPKKCSKCGKGGRINGHHADYSKPLDVDWVCDSCHQKEHNAALAQVDTTVLQPGEWSSVQFWVDAEQPLDFVDPLAVEPMVPLPTQAILHEEPEPALPEVYGSEAEPDAADLMVQAALAANGAAAPPIAAGLEWLMQGGGGPAHEQASSDIAAAAAQFLATGERPQAPGIQTSAAKVFSPAEQQKIINEGEDRVAANLASLDIAGTHYEALEATLKATDDDFLW